jgi:uncharacterized protein (DUF58 family)
VSSESGRLAELARSAAADYLLRPPSRIAAGPAGQFAGNESGTSVDFHDFREYQPGDDLRRIDWGVYARSDSLVVRQYRSEISPVVEIYLDVSASMGLYSGKRRAALLAAGLLCGLAEGIQGRPVLLFGPERVPASAVMRALGDLDFDAEDDPADAARWPRGSGRPMRFFLSDFLFEAGHDQMIASLARDAARLFLVQIISAGELNPGLTGGLRLSDAERPSRSREVRVDRAVVAQYRRRLEAHMGAIERGAVRSRAAVMRLEVPDEGAADGEDLERVAAALLRAGIMEVA